LKNELIYQPLKIKGFKHIVRPFQTPSIYSIDPLSWKKICQVFHDQRH
jgi:hypothetical protein